MILLITFIMLCCFGLGVSWNIVWTNMKELDNWLEQRKQEQKKFEIQFKQNAEEIVKLATSTNDLKEQLLKKKH